MARSNGWRSACCSPNGPGCCSWTSRPAGRSAEFIPPTGRDARRGGINSALAIARALLTDPKILSLDEPTEGIQPSIIDQIGETLLKIKAEGKASILLVEQYLDFALSVADRFYVMERGRIVADGPIGHLNEDVVNRCLAV